MHSKQTNEPLLAVKDLSVAYSSREIGTCHAVNGVSFEIQKGEVFGLVGETGAGKTTIAMSLLNLIPEPPGKITAGSILFKGENLLQYSKKQMRKVRGKEISMIFQDPMTALNPVDTVGEQIAEVIYLHQNVSKKESWRLAGEMMESVGIPAERYSDFPHQFSGGMKQRIVIAMALACNPKILIADEPTTSLDVTIEAQILDVLKNLQKTLGTSIILITHDLGVIAKLCDRVLVMYGGKIVERGSVDEIFYDTAHPYTKGLMHSIAKLDTAKGHKLQPIEGTPPDLFAPPKGCPFAARCEYCMEICKEQMPEVTEFGDGHEASCWLHHPLAPKVEMPGEA